MPAVLKLYWVPCIKLASHGLTTTLVSATHVFRPMSIWNCSRSPGCQRMLLLSQQSTAIQTTQPRPSGPRTRNSNLSQDIHYFFSVFPGLRSQFFPNLYCVYCSTLLLCCSDIAQQNLTNARRAACSIQVQKPAQAAAGTQGSLPQPHQPLPPESTYVPGPTA